MGFIQRIFLLCAITAILTACVASRPRTVDTQPAATLTAIQMPQVENTPTTAASTPTQTTTATAVIEPTNSPTAPVPTAGPKPTLSPDAWKRVPVIPSGVSQRVLLIYQMGLMNGNNPHVYSKVGDCNVTMPYFLGDFDSPGKYQLDSYSSLQSTVDYFAGSHSLKSLAAKQGLTAHAALSVLWVDWKECETYETPLTCEYRLHKPMYALISFGTNDANGNVDFDKALRRVIDMTIGNGTIPILVTKADNAEGDESINRTIVNLAYEYDLPVWNYWAAVQGLPNNGLKDAEHMEHLSEGKLGLFNFTSENLQYGWPVRNLTALQALDAVRKAVEAAQK